MTHQSDMRLAIWRDELSPAERAEVDFILGMEGGTHATAYLAVGQIRLATRIAEQESRNLLRDGAKGFGAVAALMVTAIASYLASSHGVPKP